MLIIIVIVAKDVQDVLLSTGSLTPRVSFYPHSNSNKELSSLFPFQRREHPGWGGEAACRAHTGRLEF